MGYAMAVPTVGILLMNCRAVRLAVTLLAGWQFTMGGMALCAGQGRMFRLPCLQQIISLIMAAGANFFGLGKRIRDIQRGMNRVAGQAVGIRKCNHGAMIFMALITLRDTAMLLRMTGGAFMLGMLAYLGRDAGSDL